MLFSWSSASLFTSGHLLANQPPRMGTSCPSRCSPIQRRNKLSNLAYQATEEDVENVLRSNSLHVANTNGKSFNSIAQEVFVSLDFDLIEQAALFGDSLDEQTDYANDEIARQLRESGILEPIRTAHSGSNNG